MDIDSLQDKWVHVASYALNAENSEEFEASVAGAELNLSGMRLDWEQLFEYLEKQGKNVTKLWNDIKHLIVMSITSVEREMYHEFKELAVSGRKRRMAPFEMVGYDILIDSKMKPWLIEINNSPSLSPHTELENKIKENMIRELFNIVDIQNSNWTNLENYVDHCWDALLKLKLQGVAHLPGDTNFNLIDLRTREDLWTLVETEWENQRTEKYIRLFPTASSEQYLKYLTNPRNRLVVNWIHSGLRTKDILSYSNPEKVEL